MKRKKLLVLSFAMLLVGGLALVTSVRFSFESAVKHRAVVAPREAFRDADRFEILFLEADEKRNDEETFSISPSRTTFRVVAAVELSDGRSDDFKKLLSKHTLTKEFSAMCHTPHHAIRAFRGSDSIFEATLCLECDNMEFAAFGFFPVEVTIYQNERLESGRPILAEFLERLLMDS